MLQPPIISESETLTDRRTLLAGLVVLMAASSPVQADDAALNQAAAFIREAGQRLASLVQSHPSEAEMRRKLVSFVDDVADVAGVARFCLGRFWPSATSAQQQEYVQLFRQVLVNAVAARVGGYSSGQFHVAINSSLQVGTDIQVPTDVSRGDSTPQTRVIWTVNEDTGRLRIVDIIAEGVSLRLTQRSDYASFLRQNNNDIPGLLRALHAQVGSG